MKQTILKLFLISFIFSANVFAMQMQVEEAKVPEALITSVIELINLDNYNDIDTKFASAEKLIKDWAKGDLTDDELKVLAASVKNNLENQDRFDAKAIRGKISNIFTKNNSLLKGDKPYPNLNTVLTKISISLNKADESVKQQDGHGNRLRLVLINNRSALIFFTVGTVTISYILYYHNPSELRQILSSQEFWQGIYQQIWTQIQNTPGYTRTGYDYAQTGFNCTVEYAQTGYELTQIAFNHTGEFLQNVLRWIINYRGILHR